MLLRYLESQIADALLASLFFPLMLGLIFCRTLWMGLLAGIIGGTGAPLIWRALTGNWSFTEDEIVRLVIGALIGAGLGLVGWLMTRGRQQSAAR